MAAARPSYLVQQQHCSKPWAIGNSATPARLRHPHRATARWVCKHTCKLPQLAPAWLTAHAGTSTWTAAAAAHSPAHRIDNPTRCAAAAVQASRLPATQSMRLSWTGQTPVMLAFALWLCSSTQSMAGAWWHHRTSPMAQCCCLCHLRRCSRARCAIGLLAV
jgi:hypothetical protein